MLNARVTKEDIFAAAPDISKGAQTLGTLDRALDLANKCLEPNYVIQYYSITKTDGKVYLDGCDFALIGSSIYTHLAQCDRLALIGACVGLELDRAIETLRLTDLSTAYLVDLCGSIAVEKLADNLEQAIRAEEAAKGNGVTARFSCGYGDFPLSSQRKIIELLQLDKSLGVRLTEGDMMVPTKSVTAVIGIGRDVTAKSGRCINCAKLKDCKGGLCNDRF